MIKFPFLNFLLFRLTCRLLIGADLPCQEIDSGTSLKFDHNHRYYLETSKIMCTTFKNVKTTGTMYSIFLFFLWGWEVSAGFSFAVQCTPNSLHVCWLPCSKCNTVYICNPTWASFFSSYSGLGPKCVSNIIACCHKLFCSDKWVRYRYRLYHNLLIVLMKLLPCPYLVCRCVWIGCSCICTICLGFCLNLWSIKFCLLKKNGAYWLE